MPGTELISIKKDIPSSLTIYYILAIPFMPKMSKILKVKSLILLLKLLEMLAGVTSLDWPLYLASKSKNSSSEIISVIGNI